MLHFIAIVAPPAIDEQVLVWKKYMEQEYGCKVALRSPAHITLVPPFNMPSEKEKMLGQHLALFSSGEKSFSIQLRDFDSFAPKVIFVNGSALNSNLILLNSTSNRFPDGLGNDSGDS